MARRRPRTGGMEPLTPQRKWMVITVATLLLAPAFWAMLAGQLAFASDDSDVSEAAASAAIAFGLAVIPFVFMILAFGSAHPQAPGAVLRAMGLCLVVGIMVSAVAADAVTGVVAGVGAGGVVALRKDLPHDWRTRATAVALAAAYAFVLARTSSAMVVLSAPVFPLTAIGMADHWSERRRRSTDR